MSECSGELVRRGTLLELWLPPTPNLELTGEWDSNRLQQVVANLIGNALKYSAVDKQVEIDLKGDENMVTLRVRDHGIGIPSEDILHVFSRYSRAHNAVEGGIEGLGLGLYLSKGIVEAHGGRIWVESDGQDQGTAVTVVLPRQQNNFA